MTADAPHLLSLEGVTKAFPGVLANDDVSFDLRRGEIHALLGENGAGKTTLMGMLFGLHRPDAGRILIEGKEVELSSPRQALNRGIAFVQQHYSLISALSVLDNILLSQRYGRAMRLTRRQCLEKIKAASKKYGLHVRADARIEDLGVAEQQRVELLKALIDDPKLLILDEPSALLSHHETDELWHTLRTLSKAGVAIILIAHKLDEVLAISDRITVLRRGRKIATVNARDVDAFALSALMVGDIPRTAPHPSAERQTGKVVLSVTNVTIKGDRGYPIANDISFEVCAGEILGIAGVAGGGQTELVETIAGIRSDSTGCVLIDERKIPGLSVRARQQLGLAYVPPDRHKDGLVGPLTIAENLSLAATGVAPAVSRSGVLHSKSMAELATKSMERFDIRARGHDTPCSKLSGGNQQKVILARELARRPKAILCCYPTRGLDFAATAAVHAELRDAATRGSAVLVVSLDLLELMTLCDRILVMQGGHIRGGGATSDLSEQKLGLLLGGEALQ
jgi:general nucleoside transport system ATP-binding protein